MLRFYDSLDLYSDVDDMHAGGFVFQNPGDILVATTGGRTGLGHVAIRDQGQMIVPVAKTNLTGSVIYVGFSFRMDSLPVVDTNPFLNFYGGGAPSIELRISSGGAIEVWKANGGGMLGTTLDGIVSAATWHHMEVRFFNNNPAGEVSIKIGEFEVLFIFGLNTVVFDAGRPDTVVFYRGVDVAVDYTRFDDIVIWDDAAAAQFGDVSYGDMVLAPLVVSADVVVDAGYTKSSGGNYYEELEDPIPGGNDGDGTYIQTDEAAAAASPASAIFANVGAPNDMGVIVAVGLVHEGRRTANGLAPEVDFVMRGDYPSAAVDLLVDPLGVDAIRPPIDVVMVRSEAVYVDPATGVDWIKAGIDDLGMGINFNGL